MNPGRAVVQAPLTVLCPGCGGKAVYAATNPWRPFCSERCRNQDLGAWASERFRIPATPSDQPDDAATDETGPRGRDP